MSVEALREVAEVEQPVAGARRRLFVADSLELYLFEGDDGAPLSFQLAYRREGGHGVLEYRGGRLYHAELDRGPGDWTAYDRAGLLSRGDEAPDAAEVAAVASRFGATSEGLPASVRRFVAAALAGAGGSP